MSNLVFPSWNPPQIDRTWPQKKTPVFSTIVQTPTSKRGEVRIPLQTFPVWDFVFNLQYIKGDATITNCAYLQLQGFFGAVQGQADDWLYVDPYDHAVANQTIGTGDGTTKQFLFYRDFGNFFDLVQNFQAPPSVYLAGVLQSSSTYSIDSYGNLYFNTAPGVGVIVSWSGSFYFRCRFLDDTWADLQEIYYQVWRLEELKFRSVLL